MATNENDRPLDELGIPTAGDSPADRVSEEEIDYNVMGSFPASDPPSWTLGVRPNKTFHTEFDGESPSPKDPTHQNEPAK